MNGQGSVPLAWAPMFAGGHMLTYPQALMHLASTPSKTCCKPLLACMGSLGSRRVALVLPTG
jgi:hypothetical protein